MISIKIKFQGEERNKDIKQFIKKLDSNWDKVQYDTDLRDRYISAKTYNSPHKTYEMAARHVQSTDFSNPLNAPNRLINLRLNTNLSKASRNLTITK